MDLKDRKLFSVEMLKTLKGRFTSITELQAQNQLCIYTTGSYGRHEAGKFSDIDLFFLIEKDTMISKIEKILIDAEIIRSTRELGLPEFSGDGEYLEVHAVETMIEKLGGRDDDYYNYFTARMLLLLESKPLFNEEAYDRIIERTLNVYYSDYENHLNDFQPVFIVNDIIRFWRTMCLNYEHNRKKRIQTAGETAETKIKSAIKNLKLKFSRKLTCYSMLLSLLWIEDVSKESVLELVKMTPIERLGRLKEFSQIHGRVEELIRLYHWFLETSQIDSGDLYIWMSKEENRQFALERANRFGEVIFEIMQLTPNNNRLRYYLV